VRHEVKRQLDLVAAIGCYTADQRLSFRIPQAAHERAMAKLGAAGVQVERPWLVLHPGASAASRRYPPRQFAAAAQVLVVKHGWQIVFTGSAPENELVESIRRAINVPTASLAGELDLGELGAVIAQARVLLTNNSGPAHIAAAVGTPVVDLYALTNPQHTPWAVPARVLFHDVPCKFCYKSVCPQQHHRCLRMISPLQVVNAVQELAHSTEPAVAPAALPGTLPGHWRSPPAISSLPTSHVYPGN
jgi:lipopolysaccharide heptosyltransferase II